MNINLISADSFRLIDKEVKKIVKDNPIITINFAKSSIREIVEEASYFGFGVEEKYIVVTNTTCFGADKISDEEVKMLLNYFDQPNPNTFLIFTTLDGVDARKKIVKSLKDKYNCVIIPPWDKKKTREEAIKYLESFNYKIDYNTITYLIENSFNSIDVLFNELDKIMLFYNVPTQIRLEDVAKIVGKEADSNNFHFVDAVISKDLERSLNIMNSLKIYKTEAVVLINLLAREYRLMYYVKRKRAEGKNIGVICKEMALQEWQVSKLYNNSNNFTEDELLSNIYQLGEIDVKLKSGVYDKDCALYPFLLEACI